MLALAAVYMTLQPDNDADSAVDPLPAFCTARRSHNLLCSLLVR
jgi:hypothetical protein